MDRNGNNEVAVGANRMEQLLPTPQTKKRGRPPKTSVLNVDGKEADRRLAEATEGVAIQQVHIPALDLRTLEMIVVGDSPLIVHAWDEKTIKMIADKQGGDAGAKRSKGREARNPEAEFRAASYKNEDGFHCAPARNLKASMVEAVRFIPGNDRGQVFSGKLARGVLQVLGDLLPLISPAPRMRTDMARLQSGVSSPVYRPEYWPWALRFHIRYNAQIIDAAGIATLFTLAGFHSGLCEWRPERGGGFGMYHVGDEKEFASIVKDAKKARKKK